MLVWYSVETAEPIELVFCTEAVSFSTFLLYLPSLQIFPTVALPFFLLKYLLHGFPGLFTVISGHICFLLLVFSPVFTLFSCRFRAVD